ncbi:MAG: calcium/sodium antiporter [Myxococcales bacterium]|nr:calcium/sodium antiporter [Myxococcales bacterium]MCB9671152.1 calcium/sodium antiporter [Alphaproteobacteria bacterium]MCB9691670.1 calcium/sodium antiporter [Alphaproteobacteria bacterium]
MFLVTFLIGLVMLVGGAHFLVEGGGRVAVGLRVPAMVVGLTIVAFGTSAPELSVSVMAALEASTAMAMSNVNGSNIANIFFVLGLAAMVHPLTVERSLLRRDIPTCIGLQLLVILLALDGTFGRVDGVIVVLGGVFYNLWLLYDVRRGRASLEDEVEAEGSLAVNVAKLVAGLVVLVLGARLFVDAAVEAARFLHFSDRMIGLTVVALGTSAPETAAALAAARKGEVDMAVGGSVGSNIFNIAMVLGITACIAPIDLSSGGFLQDMGMALVAALLLVGVVARGGIFRSDGIVLVLVYIAYIALGVYQGMGA